MRGDETLQNRHPKDVKYRTSRGIRSLSLWEFVFEIGVLIFAQSRIYSNLGPRMKILSVALSFVVIFFCTALARPLLPPVRLRAQWPELKTKGFEDWVFEKFEARGAAADGGSLGYTIHTAKGEKLDVIAANPFNYWTEEEIKNRVQVFWVSHKSRFYRVEKNSDLQTALLKKLRSLQPKLRAQDDVVRRDLAKLIEGLETRASFFHKAEEKESANKSE